MYRAVVLLLCVFVGGSYGQRQRCKIDIAMLVDGSGSIVNDYEPREGAERNWEQIQDFLGDFVEDLEVGPNSAQIALITFDSGSEVVFDLTEYTDANVIEDKMRNLQYKGGVTDTHLAVQNAREQVFVGSDDRNDAPNVILILTDGQPTREDETRRQINLIKSTSGVNARVLAVGVTDNTDEGFMRDIVTNSNTDYYPVANFASLNAILDNLAANVCPPEQCPIDLIMVIDESGSIRDDNPNGDRDWNLIKEFAVQVVRQLFVGPSDTHVALVTFANEATEHFPLNRYSSSQGVIDYIERLMDKGGETNTTGALRHVRQQILRSDRGDRENARDVIILMTDGGANREQGGLTLEADELKGDGVKIIGIGVTERTNEDELRNIVSDASRDYFKVDQFTDLQAEVVNIVAEACGQSQVPPRTTTTTTTTTTTRPPVLDPTDCDDMVAFSVYAMHSTLMQMSVGDKMVFDGVETNMGGFYDISTNEFTCSCTGMYEFTTMMSHVDQGFVFAFYKDGVKLQPVAYANPTGSAATTTITRCNRDQRVSVQVVRTSASATIGCTFENDSIIGLTGKRLWSFG